MANDKLTPKQEKFCLEYFKCSNATEAYRRTYSVKNMKPASVNRLAFAVLQNIKVASRIKSLQEAVAKKVIISKERVLQILAEIGEEGDRNSDRVAALKQVCKIFGWETTTSVIEFNKNATAPMDRLMGKLSKKDE